MKRTDYKCNSRYIIAAYSIDDKNSSVSTKIIALSNLNHSELWNKTFDSTAIAIPDEDVTGDGLSDIVVCEIYAKENSTDADITLLIWTDGLRLWKRCHNSSIEVASTAPDLTDDGIKDFAVYRFSTSGNGSASVEASLGDDGSMLWRTLSMILLPQ